MHILITGAGTGLGRALAEAYAAAGVRLTLIGRRKDMLRKTAELCAMKDAIVDFYALDVTDRERMEQAVRTADAASPLTLVIANAGVSAGPEGGEPETTEQVLRIFETNLTGTLHTVQPAIPLMLKRGEGQIAVISSLAGFRGLGTAPAYSASKCAVKAYGEGLRGSLKRHGIHVSVICPGFVRTPMTDVNPFPMPLLMEPEKAAAIIRKRLLKKKRLIAFPLPLFIGAWLLQFAPSFVMDWLARKVPAKPAMTEAGVSAPPPAAAGR